jgi:uncharacterized protein DUF6894
VEVVILPQVHGQKRPRPWALSPGRDVTMPRYFFNMMEGRSRNLVRDIDGILLADASKAREEAIGLAQDISSHGLAESMKTWTVVVTDDGGAEVLTVPLSETGARKPHAARSEGRLIGRGIALLDSRVGRGAVLWIVAVAAVAIAARASLTSPRPMPDSRGFQTASALPSAAAANEGAVVAVRFKPQSSVADVTRFLEAYAATLAGGPLPGNLYRLRIGDANLSQAELGKIVARMAREETIELAVAAQ